MQTTSKQISDSAILSLIAEDNLEGWGYLYDKYAPVMYGIIGKHTPNEFLAEEILMQLFIQLKDHGIILKINFALCVCILRHTYTNTKKELPKRGIKYAKSTINGNSLLHTFCSQHVTIKEVSTNLKISKEDVSKNLHTEFLALQSQIQQSYPPQYEQPLIEPVFRYT